MHIRINLPEQWLLLLLLFMLESYSLFIKNILFFYLNSIMCDGMILIEANTFIRPTVHQSCVLREVRT